MSCNLYPIFDVGYVVASCVCELFVYCFSLYAINFVPVTCQSDAFVGKTHGTKHIAWENKLK